MFFLFTDLRQRKKEEEGRERGRERERRKRDINLLFQSFMHSLVVSCMRTYQGSTQNLSILMMLQSTELTGQGQYPPFKKIPGIDSLPEPPGEHWEEVKMRGFLSGAQPWKNNGRVLSLRPDDPIHHLLLRFL